MYFNLVVLNTLSLSSMSFQCIYTPKYSRGVFKSLVRVNSIAYLVNQTKSFPNNIHHYIKFKICHVNLSITNVDKFG